MANVQFLRGVHSQLPTTATDGVFYLTTDTNRLYVGNGSNMVELNKSITTVAEVKDLPKTGVEDGQFYYVENGNILCIYDSGTSAWVQVNKDTYLDTKKTTTDAAFKYTSIEDGVITLKTVDTGDNTIVHTFTIDVAGNLTAETDSTNNKITLSYTTPPVSLVSEKVDNGAKITVNQGTDEKGAGIPVGDFIVEGDGTYITSKYENKVLTLSGIDMYVDSISSRAENEGFSISVVDGDSQNHSIDMTTTINPVITVKGSDGNPVADGVKFIQGTATVDTYSTKAIKDLISEAKKGFNAMEYKGAIENETKLNEIINSKTVSVGDTYKITSDFNTSDNKEYKTGDLVIFLGTEDKESGYITNNLTWDIIPSGNEFIYVGEHQVNNNSHTINLYGSLDGVIPEDDENKALSLTLNGGNKITINTDSTDRSKVTISHETYDPIQTSSSDDIIADASGKAEITAVTGMTRDNYGHITGITTQKMTVYDTHNGLDSFAQTFTATNNLATLTSTVSDTDDTSKSDSVYLTSSNLTIAQGTGANSAKTVSINLEWGTFGTT